VGDDDQFCLIRALKQGDRWAWNAAVDRHLGEVYGFVYHLAGGDRAVAEDLNQETWLEAIDAIGQCDAARGSFRNWLFGIARRRVALYYRRRGLAGNPMPFDDRFEEAGELGGERLLPGDALAQVEQASVVRAAMLVLPEDRRKALVWKYIEGLSVATIAGRMERTAKAVESLLTRAREQLRTLLRDYVQTGSDEAAASEERNS
jgi:RNA polymerase sigma-70 factor, ECF subfamily